MLLELFIYNFSSVLSIFSGIFFNGRQFMHDVMLKAVGMDPIPRFEKNVYLRARLPVKCF
jgi:hypothetical protein